MKLKRQLILRKNYKGQITGLFSPLLEKNRALKARVWIKGKSVLDCACGQAKLLSLLPKDVTYVGIDQDQPLITNNQKRYPKVKFLCVNIEQRSYFISYKLPKSLKSVLVKIAVFVEPVFARILNRYGYTIIISAIKRPV